MKAFKAKKKKKGFFLHQVKLQDCSPRLGLAVGAGAVHCSADQGLAESPEPLEFYPAPGFFLPPTVQPRM